MWSWEVIADGGDAFANETPSITKGRKMKGYVRIMRKLNRSLIFVHVAVIIFASSPSFFNKRKRNSNP